MIRNVYRVRALVAVAALSVVMAASALEAGEARRAGIPPRIQKVKEGDWILYRNLGENDVVEYNRETATSIEKVENDLIVNYTMQEFDANGKAKGKPQEVSRFLSDEQNENAEFLKDVLKNAKAQKRKVKIEGRDLEVVVFVVQEDEHMTIEYWYSDDIGVDGKVAMVVLMPDEQHSERPFEAVGFGNAKTKFDIKKYLVKK